MKAGAATMLSAAVLLAPGCERRVEPKPGAADALRRAAYRSFVARDRAEACSGETARARLAYEDRRLSELQRLAAGKKAGHALWLGENDWNAVSSTAAPAACPSAQESARLTAYSMRLDALAAAVAEFRE